MIKIRVIEGPNVHDQIAFCAFHSSLVEVQTKARLHPGGGGGGGGAGSFGYFLGGYVPPRTPNWHPFLKKTSQFKNSP